MTISDLFLLQAIIFVYPMVTGFSAKVPILTPSEVGTSGATSYFDTNHVVNPVILHYKDEWQCYYYGNNGSWKNGVKSFVPTGSVGLATSSDGITWTKYRAVHQADGAILSPSDDPEAWDACHIGVGDVVVNPNDSNELIMYYFGGSNEKVSIAGPPPASSSDLAFQGLRMRIGIARSVDNGRTWKKDPMFCLDSDPSEGLFCSWPRVLTPGSIGDPWRMFYHAFNGVTFRVFEAKSPDGLHWERTGLVLTGTPNAFDAGGIGTRDVVAWRDGLLMIYEGVEEGVEGIRKHRIGAAFCRNGENQKWLKLNDGNPILEPGVPPLGNWCKHVIGTPFVVNMPDGSLRIYHCGSDQSGGKMSIGVVASVSGEIDPSCWKALF
jgi:predicted GH43/DUF377 family glycosyl hydrolase